MSDPMLERIRETRREIAREFNYDLKKYMRYIEHRQKADKQGKYITREEMLRRIKQDEQAESAPQTAPRPPRARRTSRSTGRGRVEADGHGGAASSRRETPAGNTAR